MIRKKRERSGPVVVDLTGPAGNAFALMGYAKQWAKQLGLDSEAIIKEMMASDYEHLLEVIEKYFGEYVIMER